MTFRRRTRSSTGESTGLRNRRLTVQIGSSAPINVNNSMRIQDLQSSFNGIAYHGSNALFDQFDQKHARVANDLYGGGVAYFTDSIDIANGYAQAMTRKKGGTPTIYKVQLTLNNMFDVDNIYTGDTLINLLPKNLETFARAAGMMRPGVDKYDVLYGIESGNAKLSGDLIFKGLSNNTKTAEAREILRRKGFDGLRYTGGKLMNMPPHNVYLAYSPSSIEIIDRKQ